MDTKHSQQAPSDRGEGKIAPRTPGKPEGEQRESEAANKEELATNMANAADEAGSAFLPRDKVLSDADDK